MVGLLFVKKIPKSCLMGVAQRHLSYFFRFCIIKGTTVILTVVILDFSTQATNFDH